MRYRRPKVYVPPYTYCDRWCARCRIDKSRCLLYQTEMDERLHREIDGLGEPTLEETIGRIRRDAESAATLLRDQRRLLPAEEDPASAPPTVPAKRSACEEEAAAVTRALAAFTRAHGADFPDEAEVLRHLFALPAPKLGRASRPAVDEVGEADAILQAQAAHRALAGMSDALEAIRLQRRGLGDEMLDLLAAMKALREAVEARWLRRPCALLEPVPGSEWWGPLRDVTPTLRQLRRGP